MKVSHTPSAMVRIERDSVPVPAQGPKEDPVGRPPEVHDSGAPRVSVIVPAYRQSRFVESCLNSIHACQYPNLEVIFVDDASPEDDAARAEMWSEAYASTPIRVIRHARNVGLSQSLNETIPLASGDYVALLAADDVLLPGGLIERVRFLERNPWASAVFSDSTVIDESGRTISQSAIEDLFRERLMRKRHLRSPALIAQAVSVAWAVPGPVMMARRTAIQDIGGYDESLAVEDWDLYLRFAERHQLGFTPGPVAGYRKHGDNTGDRFSMRTRVAEDRGRTADRHTAMAVGPAKMYLWAFARRVRSKNRRFPLGPMCVLACRVLQSVATLTYFSWAEVNAVITRGRRNEGPDARG